MSDKKISESERHRARHADPPRRNKEVLLEETTYKVKKSYCFACETAQLPEALQSE